MSPPFGPDATQSLLVVFVLREGNSNERMSETPRFSTAPPAGNVPPAAPWYARHFRLLCGVGFLLLGLAVYAPALGESRLVYGRDTRFHDYIMHLYGWERINTVGEWPLWCPELFCGLPFQASFALCPFYPTQWLYFVLPFNTGFTMQYVLGVAAGGLTAAWWVRRVGARRAVAAWAGIAFVFSGHFLTLTHAGHLQKLLGIAWAPAALAAVTVPLSGARGNRLRCYLIAAAALAFQLLASHPQIFYATVLASGAAVLIDCCRRGLTFAEAGSRLLGTAGAAGLGIVLAAIQIFPGMEMAPFSNRGNGVSFAEAVETSYPPLEILEYVVPSVLGDSLEGSPVPYFGRWGSERIVSDYVGSPLVLLALLGLLARSVPWRLRVYLGLLAVISVVVGLGSNAPLYRWLYDWMPGWKSYRSPGTFMFLADLALIALAALGLEHLLRRREGAEHRGARSSAAACALLAVTALAAAGATWWISRSIPVHAGGNESALRLHLLRDVVLLGLELGGASILLATCYGSRKRFLPAALAAGALLLPAVHNRRYVRFEPLAPFLHYLKHPLYAAAGREAPWKTGPVRLLEEQELRTAGILSEVGTPLGYHPILLAGWQRMVEALHPGSRSLGSLMGIWLGRTSGEAPPAGQSPAEWERVGRFGSTPSAVLWRRAGQPLPYARAPEVVSEVQVAEDRTKTFSGEDVLTSKVFLEQEVLTEHGLRPGAQETPALVLRSWSAHEIRLQVVTPVPRRAVVTLAEVAAPGWKASGRNGAEIPLVRVNLGQRGLILPGAVTDVVLRYAPYSQRLGAFCSLLSGAVLILFAAGGRQRRKPADTSRVRSAGGVA